MQKIVDISKLCRECISWQNGQCPGKDKSKIKPDKLPCKNYELDMNLVSDQDIEPGSKPPSLKKPDKVKPLIPGSVLPTNAKKAANFERLAIKRLNVLLDDFRKLSNLSNKATYEWVQEQTDAMLSRIRSAADELEKKFQK